MIFREPTGSCLHARYRLRMLSTTGRPCWRPRPDSDPQRRPGSYLRQDRASRILLPLGHNLRLRKLSWSLPSDPWTTVDFSPSKGVILTRIREKGGIVNACETVFALTLMSTIWVRTYVGEPDLGLVQPGMKVMVTTDAASGREYAGQIGFVSPTAEFTPKTVETSELRTALVYRLRVVVNDPDDGLRQGMPVTVSVRLPGKRPRTFKERMEEALNLEWLLSSKSGG